MTATPPVRTSPRPTARTVELVLAHTHLRLGSLALARVELETMAGMGLLDTGGIVDLAEVRWRTGDLLGAGEAASAALRDDPDLPIALVISAEAAAALGRPTEARRLADKAIRTAGSQIDLIFAGMPRSGVWPADVAEPPPTAPTLFDREPEPAVSALAGIPGLHERPVERKAVPAVPATPLTLGLWETDQGTEAVGTPLPEPAAELEAGRAALVAGNIDEAALRFGIALRLAPALAPAVLEATDGARGAALTLVRGDAYRMAGHDAEAQQAYVIAAYGGLPERRKEPRHGPPGPGGGVAPASLSSDAPAEAPSAGAFDADPAPDAGSEPDPAAAGEPGPSPAAEAEAPGGHEPAEASAAPASTVSSVASTRVVASAKAGATATPPSEPAVPAAEPAAVAARTDPGAKAKPDPEQATDKPPA
jgi:tetratricopeptide (TPR) repeat protein